MQKSLGVHFIAACMLLSGCNGDDDETNISAINSESYIGTWVAPAYGTAMVVGKDRLYEYQYTSSYCIQSNAERGSGADLANQFWQLSEDQQSMRQILNQHGVEQRGAVYAKTGALPDSCLQSLVKVKEESGYQADATRDFEMFWQTFNEYYPTFDKRNVDWAAQREQVTVSLTSDSSDEDLFYALAEMVAPLGDSHVEVRAVDSDSGVNVTSGVTLLDRIAEEYISANGTINNDQQYVQYLSYQAEQIDRVNQIRISYAADDNQIKQAANGQLIWFITTNNIGYLSIENMAFFAGDSLDELDFVDELNVLKPAIEQAMSELANTNGLVIDIRQNPGGFDAASQMIAKHFLDTERHLYSKQARLGNSRTKLETYSLAPVASPYLKPVVLLTSAASTSAAEVFTLMLRELPHVTLVGEATQGAISDILEKTLPNGFEIDLVNEYYLTPDGEWFEGEGIPVDYHVEFGTQSQRLAGIDEGIDLALSLLTN